MADSNATNTAKRYGIRKRVWEQGKNVSPTDLAEAMRDVDTELGKIYARQIKEPTVQYDPTVGPFTVDFDHNPWGIICIRIRPDKGASNAMIASGGGQCSFDWSNGTIRIYSVGSFTTPGRYVFTLEIIG